MNYYQRDQKMLLRYRPEMACQQSPLTWPLWIYRSRLAVERYEHQRTASLIADFFGIPTPKIGECCAVSAESWICLSLKVVPFGDLLCCLCFLISFFVCLFWFGFLGVFCWIVRLKEFVVSFYFILWFWRLVSIAIILSCRVLWWMVSVIHWVK